jgi:hypothetical protein
MGRKFFGAWLLGAGKFVWGPLFDASNIADHVLLVNAAFESGRLERGIEKA